MPVTRQAIPQWLLLGSFPHADWPTILNPLFIPEPLVSPVAGEMVGKRVWTPVKAEDGRVDLLARNFPVANDCVAYAFTYVHAPQAGPATLLLGSDDGPVVYLNGRAVWRNHAERGMALDQDVVPVQLEAGWNRLLLKISQLGGAWQFSAALQTAVPLRFALRPPAGKTKASSQAAAADVSVTDLSLALSQPKPTVRLTIANRGAKPARGLVVTVADAAGTASFTTKLATLKAQEAVLCEVAVPLAKLAAVLADPQATATVEHGGQRQAMPLAANLAFETCLSAASGGLAGEPARAAATKLRAALDLAPLPAGAAASQARQALSAIARGDSGGAVAALDALAALAVAAIPDYKSKTAHVIGHAHIDMNWLWTYRDTVWSCHDTFRQVLAFMDEFPDFHFMQSQPSTYKAVEKLDPPLFARIKQRVAEGRWELGGGQFSEGDTNMSSGEALARTFLLGQRYFLSRFNQHAVVGWLPDNFGHVSQLPQVLRLAGCEFFYFHRCKPFTGTFWWQAPDGSKVLCYSNNNYNQQVSPTIRKDFDQIVPNSSRLLQIVGVGDHGGGPTRKDLEAVRTVNATPRFPTVRCTRAQEFFRASEPDMGSRPTHAGEMQYIFEGCYTSIARVKEGNRRCESALYAAELLASLRRIAGQDYPADSLRQAWEIVAFNQFHDILCGSAIHESNADAVADYKWALSRAENVRDHALRSLADEVQTDRAKGHPIVAFNPHPRPVTTLVEAEVFTHDLPATANLTSWFDYYGAHKVVQRDPSVPPSVMLRDPAGKTIPAQIVGGKNFPPGWRWRVRFVAQDLPAGGYRAYYLDPAKPAPGAKPMAEKNGSFTTNHFRVDVDLKTGDIKGLFDKRSGKQLVKKGGRANGLRIYLEKPHPMTAWDIGPIAQVIDVKDVESVKVTERGPVRACIESVKTWNRSRFIQRVYIYQSYPRIDFEVEAHWFEQGTPKTDSPMLRAIFPLAIAKPAFNCHVPFDVVSRPTTGREVPAQQWVDVSSKGHGVALLNQTKYGHSFDEKTGELRLTLLRSSYDPDIYPDQGLHRIHYALFPHAGDWKAGVWNEGELFNAPVLAIEPPSAALGQAHATRPEEESLLSLSPATLVLSGLKQAEDGERELVVRIAEVEGRSVTATLTLPAQVRSARRLDLIERPLDAAAPAVSGRTVTVPVRAHEIVTMGLTF